MPAAVTRLVRKLADRYQILSFCYGARPSGYERYRQILARRHDLAVEAVHTNPVAPVANAVWCVAIAAHKHGSTHDLAG